MLTERMMCRLCRRRGSARETDCGDSRGGRDRRTPGLVLRGANLADGVLAARLAPGGRLARRRANNKYDSVAKHHLAYSTTNVEKFQEYVVCSIEKNRGGRDRVDLEFRSHFDRGYFDPLGGAVIEQLIDDRTVAT
jgi:hypothetical protein